MIGITTIRPFNMYTPQIQAFKANEKANSTSYQDVSKDGTIDKSENPNSNPVDINSKLKAAGEAFEKLSREQKDQFLRELPFVPQSDSAETANQKSKALLENLTNYLEKSSVDKDANEVLKKQNQALIKYYEENKGSKE